MLGGHYGLVSKDERPPATHNPLGWCKHGYINHMIEFDHTGFKALRAGRTSNRLNIEHRTSNVEHRIMMSLRSAI
jgi:hypothetical protein